MTTSGNYHFMLVTPQDVEVDPVGHQIRLIPDDPPAIDLLFPAEDMTVETDEPFPLQYRSSDDYGLAEIRLIARIQGRKGKPFSKRSICSGRFEGLFLVALS